MTLTLQPLPDYVIEESDFSRFVAETCGRPFHYQQMDLWIGRKVVESGDIADLFRKHPDARHHGPAWKPT